MFPTKTFVLVKTTRKFWTVDGGYYGRTWQPAAGAASRAGKPKNRDAPWLYPNTYNVSYAPLGRFCMSGSQLNTFYSCLFLHIVIREMSPAPRVSCVLCMRSEETKVTGPLLTKGDVTAHQECLVISNT